MTALEAVTLARAVEIAAPGSHIPVCLRTRGLCLKARAVMAMEHQSERLAAAYQAFGRHGRDLLDSSQLAAWAAEVDE